MDTPRSDGGTQNVRGAPRNIPLGLSILILLLSIGSAGWLAWWLMRGTPTRSGVQLAAQRQTTQSARGPANISLANDLRNSQGRTGESIPDGIHPASGRADAWIVRKGAAVLFISLASGGGHDVSPLYVIPEITTEGAEIMSMRRRLLTDPEMRSLVSLTAQQLEELRKVAAFRGMTLTGAERKSLIALFEAWRQEGQSLEAASRLTAERNLYAGLDEVRARGEEPVSGYELRRARLVTGIVTAEQVEKFKEGFPAPAPRK